MIVSSGESAKIDPPNRQLKVVEAPTTYIFASQICVSKWDRALHQYGTVNGHIQSSKNIWGYTIRVRWLIN
jgi:hypothetical protein